MIATESSSPSNVTTGSSATATIALNLAPDDPGSSWCEQCGTAFTAFLDRLTDIAGIPAVGRS